MVATVLIADDYAPFRRIVRDMLEGSPGFQIVGEASDGITAIQLSEELKPSIIFLDISIPWMNGFDVARTIARTSPSSRIVFVTANTSLDVARAAFTVGARGYVLKMYPEELLGAAEAVMRGHIYVSGILKPHLEGGRK